jgi:hypothetical protein
MRRFYTIKRDNHSITIHTQFLLISSRVEGNDFLLVTTNPSISNKFMKDIDLRYSEGSFELSRPNLIAPIQVGRQSVAFSCCAKRNQARSCLTGRIAVRDGAQVISSSEFIDGRLTAWHRFLVETEPV